MQKNCKCMKKKTFFDYFDRGFHQLGSKKVRLGVAQKFNGLKTIISNPSLSSSFGLLTYAADHDLQVDENHDQNSQKKSFFSYIYNFFASI